MEGRQEEWLRRELGVEPGESVLSRLAEVQDRLVAEVLAQAGAGERGEAARLARELESSRDRLREVRHRLRNQLHGMVAALSAQQERETSRQTKRVLRSSVARLTALAAINDVLTEGGAPGMPVLPDLGELARQIVAQLGAQERVRVRGEQDYTALDQRRAATVALITAELVANAVEHGFWGKRKGTITVRLSEEKGRGVLEVRDDGCGFPPGFEISRPQSLGLRLVTRMVARDLSGEVSAENELGARVRVEFPLGHGDS